MESYAAFIEERMAEARTRCEDPVSSSRQTVRFEEYVPGGFGTSDAIILSDGVMDVIDLKYGKGVPVSAEGNPQMRIYGLGCYLALSWAYRIDTIRMTIFQPRLDSISTASMTTDELLTWAETELKPKGRPGLEGKGDFAPARHSAAGVRRRPSAGPTGTIRWRSPVREFADPPLLSPEEIADVLNRLPALQAWAKKVEEYALDAAVRGEAEFPGFKVVEGRSNRRYADEDAIASALRKAGFKVADIYKPRELLGITAMEKLVGKNRFGELAGQYIIKPEGAPTLVPESDKRPPLNTAAKAAEDFAETGE